MIRAFSLLQLCAGVWMGVASLAMLPGCASRYTPFSDHYSAQREIPRAYTEGAPVLLFLMDGMSVELLRNSLASGELPNLKRFFLRGKPSFKLARAVFPTLTYPNIASILTTSTVEQHAVIGNRVIYSGREVNFEAIGNRDYLNQLLADQSVFTRLSRQNRESVSLAHYFYAGATVRQMDDVHTGLAYLNHDFRYIDEKALDSLSQLLKRSQPRHLPDFSFVHLIGIDALSHQYGPASPQVRDYLHALDGRLGPVFDEIMSLEDEGFPLVTLATADHGFTTIHRIARLEKTIRAHEREGQAPIRFINEGRFAGLKFPADWSSSRRESLLAQLSASPAVRLTIERTGMGQDKSEGLRIRWRTGPNLWQAGLTFRDSSGCGRDTYEIQLRIVGSPTVWQCPDAWDEMPASPFPRYFISQISHYYRSPFAPDATILAADHVNFAPGYLGNHGGLTDQEQFVPLLERNAPISTSVAGDVPRSLDLLRFLDHAPQPAGFATTAVPDYAPGPREIPDRADLSAPLEHDTLSSVSKSDRQARTFSSGFYPGLSLGWTRGFSDLVSVGLGYDFKYVSYDGPGLTSSGQALHRFRLQGTYRFGAASKVTLQAAWGQDMFLSRAAPTQVIQDAFWLPEIRMATESRILATSLGDLGVEGSLAVLLPGGTPELGMGAGFEQRVGFYFAQPVAAADQLKLFVEFLHVNQSSQIEERSKIGLQLGATYSLSFER